MSDQKSPVERAVELLVFAPVGLAVSARELLPRMVERGRQQVTGQLSTARAVGQFAVQHGQNQAEKAFERAQASARSSLEQLRQTDGADRRGASSAPSASAPLATAAAPGPRATSSTSTASPAIALPDAAAPTRSEPAPLSSALPIPDYDSLSASQVVPRLSALTADELESVRAYESSHRARKTILSKVAQLAHA